MMGLKTEVIGEDMKNKKNLMRFILALPLSVLLTACGDPSEKDDSTRFDDWKGNLTETIEKVGTTSTENPYNILDCRGRITKHVHFYYTVFTNKATIDKITKQIEDAKTEAEDAVTEEAAKKIEAAKAAGRPTTDADKKRILQKLVDDRAKDNQAVSDEGFVITNAQFDNSLYSVDENSTTFDTQVAMPVDVVIHQNGVSRNIKVKLNKDSVAYIKEHQKTNLALNSLKEGDVVFEVDDLAGHKTNRTKFDWPGLEIDQSLECRKDPAS